MYIDVAILILSVVIIYCTYVCLFPLKFKMCRAAFWPNKWWKKNEYLHAALEEWYEGLQGGREWGVEYVLPLHVGLAHCPRVQAEQRAMPSHLEKGKNSIFS